VEDLDEVPGQPGMIADGQSLLGEPFKDGGEGLLCRSVPEVRACARAWPAFRGKRVVNESCSSCRRARADKSRSNETARS